MELKLLLSHLKHTYLKDYDKLPIIIEKHFSHAQEYKLLRVLMDHKIVVGWNIVDIKGIPPSMCIHRILIEEKREPIREAQCRLNPPMMEA